MNTPDTVPIDDSDDDTILDTVVQASAADGNTKRQQEAARYVWMCTISADSADLYGLYQFFTDNCKRFVFQLEEAPTTGYKHYQCCFSLKERKRFAGVKDLFGTINPHIDRVQDPIKCWSYCQKVESRVDGPWTQSNAPVDLIINLRTWQKELESDIKKKADDRTIIWYYDKEGGSGKTKMAKYLAVRYEALVLTNCKGADAFFAWNPVKHKIVVFNLTRSNEGHINYSAMESLKDGLVFSGKYESGTKVGNSPHVIVFANFEPEQGKFSDDRLEVRRTFW